MTSISNHARLRRLLLVLTALLSTTTLIQVRPGRPLPRAAAETSASSAPFGYWLVASDGGVFTFGAVAYRGSTGGMRLNRPIVGMASTPSGLGYWLVASDGGIFAFGDADFDGSTGGMRLNSPIVAMTRTPSGNGYWLVASDGGVFSFGDAQYFGSTGNLRLTAPVIGMAATPSGGGYWLFASDGGVFAFGDAVFAGSLGGQHLNQPVVGGAATTTGSGYWMVAADGGVFAFGDAQYFGSTGGQRLNKPVVAMATSPTDGGYWLVASDGGIFTFGDAHFRGSAGSIRLNKPIVSMATGPSSDPYEPGSTGFDISWPQCGGSYPAADHPVAIVGVNDGRAMTDNPCFGSEWAWAGNRPSVYLNTNAPPADYSAPGCTTTSCTGHAYGVAAAAYAMQAVKANSALPIMWWLDVETKNTWPQDPAANTAVIQGFVDELSSAGLTVGVYSTPYQWGVITGGAAFGLPLWEAGAPQNDPGSYCTGHPFAGGRAWLAQTVAGGFDNDIACSG